MSDPPPEFILDISDEEYRQQLYARTGALYRDYAPAGQTDQGRRTARARKAGIASGVARRKVARGRAQPHRRERTRELALGKLYPKVWQLSGADLEALYRATCEAEGWTFDRRGLNTAREISAVIWRHYRVYGQDFEITNDQISAALKNAGRPRCRRTVQLTRKRLEAMGLFHFAWVKRGTWRRDRGWCPGERKDTLRVTVLHVRRRANCTPPTGAGAAALRPTAAPALASKNDSIPPPSAADWQGGHTAAEQLATEVVGPGQRASVLDVRRRVQVVDVSLGDGERAVSQPPFDLMDRDALVHQVGGVGVSEPVRVDPLADPGLDGELMQQLPDVGGRERLPGGRLADDAEQRGAEPELERPPLGRPSLDDRASASVEADDTGLVALPVKDGDASALEVDVFGRQRDRFADAQPGAPHDDDQRPIAPAGEAAAASVDQGPDLVGGERFGREPPALDRGGLPGPVRREGHGRTVEAAAVKQRLRGDGGDGPPTGEGEHGSSLPVLKELSEIPAAANGRDPANNGDYRRRAEESSQDSPALGEPDTGLDRARAPRTDQL